MENYHVENYFFCLEFATMGCARETLSAHIAELRIFREVENALVIVIEWLVNHISFYLLTAVVNSEGRNHDREDFMIMNVLGFIGEYYTSEEPPQTEWTAKLNALCLETSTLHPPPIVRILSGHCKEIIFLEDAKDSSVLSYPAFPLANP